MRFFDWPDQTRYYPQITIPRSFIVHHSDDRPQPSIWAILTKPEKSVLVAILSCVSFEINSPTEALLAAFCGIKTRKAVRNAIYKLEKRNLVRVNRGKNRIIQSNIESEEDEIGISISLIRDGYWQVLGEECPSSHALYIAMLALMQDQRHIQHPTNVICSIAGISVRHYKVTLAQLVDQKLTSLWEWPNQMVIPIMPPNLYYKKSYLESFPVE